MIIDFNGFRGDLLNALHNVVTTFNAYDQE